MACAAAPAGRRGLQLKLQEGAKAKKVGDFEDVMEESDGKERELLASTTFCIAVFGLSNAQATQVRYSYKRDCIHVYVSFTHTYTM